MKRLENSVFSSGTHSLAFSEQPGDIPSDRMVAAEIEKMIRRAIKKDNCQRGDSAGVLFFLASHPGRLYNIPNGARARTWRSPAAPARWGCNLRLCCAKETSSRRPVTEQAMNTDAVWKPVRPDLVVWAMGRAHVTAAAAFQKLTAGFVVLLLLILAAEALNLWSLHRWGRQLLQIEERLGRFDSEAKLSKTGLKELDRLIAVFNHQTESLSKAQRLSEELSLELARAERLTALGRMSAGLAHEIRNPIGAMRLQAENGLAKNVADAYQKACRGMLQNIDRPDDLLERANSRVSIFSDT